VQKEIWCWIQQNYLLFLQKTGNLLSMLAFPVAYRQLLKAPVQFAGYFGSKIVEAFAANDVLTMRDYSFLQEHLPHGRSLLPTVDADSHEPLDQVCAGGASS
jgi:hypothetical protein